eukprot:5448949-Prymnesium_polylepis.1
MAGSKGGDGVVVGSKKRRDLGPVRCARATPSVRARFELRQEASSSRWRGAGPPINAKGHSMPKGSRDGWMWPREQG